MPNVRREDLQMKIPALLHLSRLGYGYLSGAQLKERERRTNFLPEALRDAVERINGLSMTGEALAGLIRELQEQLDAEDLGKRFYETLRDGWNGLRLIDFAHAENNLFQSASELACGRGAGSFRPDITLFVNGLPLAMIEVKTSDRLRGLQAEYDRMMERFRGKEGRRYLQCAQIWAFSDDHADDPGRLLPTEGAFFAAAMTEDFPVYAVREKHPAIFRRLLPRNIGEEERILADNGIPERPHTRDFQRSLSPKKATHRMLTTLFHPARFLFLLRYGIRYVRETDPGGTEYLTRRMLTCAQLSVLGTLCGKAKRGWRNWTVPSCGAAGEKAANASLIAVLRDLAPGARLYWVSTDHTELQREREELESCGIACAEGRPAGEDRLILLTAEGNPKDLPAEERPFSGQRIFVLPPPVFCYGQRTAFSAGLRRADPRAILVTRTTSRAPENSFSTILLRMEMKPGEKVPGKENRNGKQATG